MDVVATNFVVPTTEEIPTWMMFPLQKRFWLGNDVAVDAASEVAADDTDFVLSP